MQAVIKKGDLFFEESGRYSWLIVDIFNSFSTFGNPFKVMPGKITYRKVMAYEFSSNGPTPHEWTAFDFTGCRHFRSGKLLSFKFDPHPDDYVFTPVK